MLFVQSLPTVENLFIRQPAALCHRVRRGRPSELNEEAVRQRPQPKIPLVHASSVSNGCDLV